MDVSRTWPGRTSRLLVSETARLTGAEPPELEAVRRRTWIGWPDALKGYCPALWMNPMQTAGAGPRSACSRNKGPGAAATN
jgi:hypothetical protein